MTAPRLAGVELGGTNANLVLGDGTTIVERLRFPVSDAERTLELVRQQLEQWNAAAPIAALGIASFGPVGIIAGRPDYGQMLLTPKPSWTGADVLGTLSGAIAGPASIDLDVNAAALAEGAYGAARGCSDYAYITVGTGVGIGIVSGGRLVIGQMHPEAGHFRIRRVPGDSFEGACAFHGDCLSGLVSGSALQARTGLDGAAIAATDPIWALVVDALAEACATLFMALACQRIVIGGGVIVSRPGLVPQVAASTAAKLNGFPPTIPRPVPIMLAALGADSGIHGALLIAGQTLSDSSCKPIG